MSLVLPGPAGGEMRTACASPKRMGASAGYSAVSSRRGSRVTKRMKAIRLHLIDLSGKLVDHARELPLRLTRNHPSFAVPLRARMRIMELAFRMISPARTHRTKEIADRGLTKHTCLKDAP